MILSVQLRRILPAALGLAALTSIVSAQQPLRTLLVGADRRQSISLNGDWHYLVSPPPAGSLYDGAGKVRDNGYGLNSHPNISTGPHNDEYDFATAPTLKVPGDWNTQDPTLFRYEGVLWYQRDFTFAPPPAGARTFLHIGAANYTSHVWINAKRVCDHEGGYTPFDCEATSFLHSGSNFIVIAVDSTRHAEDIPTLNYDWFNYGGLTRDVSLITLPAQFIDDYDVHLKHGATFTAAGPQAIAGYVHVQDAPAGTAVSIEIPEAGIRTSASTDATGKAAFEVTAPRLTLWSPDTPHLYAVNLASGPDRISDLIGFRDIRTSGFKIVLNGQPVFLRGVNAHAETPVRGGRVNSDADVKLLFDDLHDLNANFVRLAHYPHDERMERAADRSGIMVWSEIPLWQRIAFDKPEVYAKAVAMLKEMVRRDRNKASVIFWSVSNETPNNPVRTEFLTNLANEARSLDPTRLITSALIGPPAAGPGSMVQTDKLADALDVVGQNEYIGWYTGTAEDADGTHWTLPQKPIIFSEFGAEAKQGNHGGDHDRWTEEQQVNVLKHQFTMLSHVPELAGVCPWVMVDFRSPGRNIPKLQDGYNRKGLISEDNRKKLSFAFIQKQYAALAAEGANAKIAPAP